MVKPAMIISGGQTGADRGGLEAALALDIPIGGWAPMGWEAEDGVVPERYRIPKDALTAGGCGLRECPEIGYGARTRRNVALCDGVIVFTFGILGSGSQLTLNLARQLSKPGLLLDLRKVEEDLVGAHVRKFVVDNAISKLMIAGTRESHARNIEKWVSGLLTQCFSFSA